jgi:hypothetical protein
MRHDVEVSEPYGIARRRGSKRAMVAVGRSILIIIWHLLSDPDVRYQDLVPASTPPASIPNVANATTSANSRRWGTPSPFNPPPDRHPSAHCLDPAALRFAGCCRLPGSGG